MDAETIEPLIYTSDEPKPQKKFDGMTILKIFGAVFSVIAISLIIYAAAASSSSASIPVSSNAASEETWETLPNCQVHPSLSCTGSSGTMDSKWANNTWNTPPRVSSRWVSGYQDMSTLVGYAQQKYNSDRTQCTVTVITRTSKDMKLTYSFDGVSQSTASKAFTSTYTGLLKIKVTSDTGATLELDDVDFIWNVQTLKSRTGDYRKGQKGAIVELFGWSDDDIAKECKTIAEAGYLGVKIFPHMEQIMSTQPMENMLNPWYFMYQPVSYRLQGRMGTRDQLRKMIQTCRSYGLRVYADAVVNHMSGAGNDAGNHRTTACVYWPGKQSSAPNGSQSPYFTHSYTYEINPYTGRATNALEFPGVPYGPMDFHCEKSLNSWTDSNILNTGWLVGLSDLDTGKDYVRQRIADYFVDLLSIGFSGFRIDAAKHIHPDDLAAIFAKLKESMGGSIPDDWITWLEVLVGGEANLLVRDSEYSYTTYFANKMTAAGLSSTDINKVKIWWSGYPSEPDIDEGRLSRVRKAIQNDDHDQQSPGSSSRDMHDQGCVLVKGCAADTHRAYEVKLFTSPNGATDNDNDYPIRFVLSSYYFNGSITSVPDGKSDCSLCKTTCNGCQSRAYTPAYVENAQAYAGSDYTRVHRDAAIIKAMRSWMHIA